METKAKKEWGKPELIVLVRSKPEEAVLGACKGTPGTGGPGFKELGCKDLNFSDCSAISIS